MKLNTTAFRVKMQHPLLLGLGTLPLTWMLLCNLAPHLLPQGSLLPVLTVPLAWLCLLLPGRKRLLAGAAGSGLLLAAGAALLLPTGGVLSLAVPLLCIAVLLASLPIGGWPRQKELPVVWHAAVLGTHLLMQLLLFGANKMRLTTYVGMQTPLTVSFLACAALMVLALNRSSLESAAQSRRTVPLLMRRQNTVLTLALLAAAAAIAAIPAIVQALGTVWNWLMRGVAFLAGLLMMLMPGGGSGSGGGGAADEIAVSAGESAPPSAFALLMEKLIALTAVVILAVAFLLLARALGKRLWKLLRHLWRGMGRYGAAASEDYEDEITDTRDEPDTEREGLLARLRRITPADEKALTPAQRVRSRYRRLKRRHGDWSRANTARETLPPEAATLYERARYSGKPLTEEDADRFREGTRKL